MSETVDRRSSITSSIKSPPDQSGGVLKKLAASKSWVSPFRQGNTRNWHKDLKELNSIDNIEIPLKFTSHPVLEAKLKEEEKAKAAESETKDVEEGEEEAAEDEEEGDNALVAESERPLSEAELHEISSPKIDEEEAENDEEAAEEDEEEAAEEDAEAADKEDEDAADGIDIVTQPESKATDAKLEAIEAEQQRIKEGFKDEPVMLTHYSELNATANRSVDKKVNDPNRVVNLGSGLKMTHGQILAIAAQRVAPMLANINEKVSKTRQEDEILRQERISQKIQGHEKKLLGVYDKHVNKIAKNQAKFDKDIDTQLTNLDTSMKTAEDNAAKFDADTRAAIQKYKDDYAEREEKAVEKHEVDKETLIKNHEELTATKQQELEDAKQGQIDTDNAITELNTKKDELTEANSGLNTEIDEIQTTLNAKLQELEELKASHEEKVAAIGAHTTERDEINSKVESSNVAIAEKQKRHGKLTAEVGVLAGTLAAYGARLATLGSDKQARPTRMAEAKDKFNKYEEEKLEAAKQVELEHLRQRKEAEEAVETKRVQAEQEAEALRIEEEAKRKQLEEETETKKREEEEKRRQLAESEETKKLEEDIARKKQEHEDAIKAEEEKLEQIQKDKELEEALKKDPEYQRQLRIQKREMEKDEIVKQREEYEAQFENRKLETEKEAENLRIEIEDLKTKQTEIAEAQRLEAERLAQLKLDEIEKLKKENEERMKIYEARIDLENLQRTRLIEEVDHLKKIRELREEKARLATQTVEDNKLSELQKLIEEREFEVHKLTRQIEMDDDEFFAFQARKKTFLGESNDFAVNEPLKVAVSSEGARDVQVNSAQPSSQPITIAPVIVPTIPLGGQSTIPASNEIPRLNKSASGTLEPSNEASVSTTSDDATKVATSESPKKRNSIRAAIGGATAAIGGATAAALAKTGSVISSQSKKVKSFSPESPASPPPSKASPTSPTLFENKDLAKADIKAPERDEPKIVRENSTVSGKTESDGVGPESDDEWETISVYEEVSSSEWDAHKDDPDYLEVTQDEFDKKNNTTSELET